MWLMLCFVVCMVMLKWNLFDVWCVFIGVVLMCWFWFVLGWVMVGFGVIGVLLLVMLIIIFLIFVVGCFVCSLLMFEQCLLVYLCYGLLLWLWCEQGVVLGKGKVFVSVGMVVGFVLFCWGVYLLWCLLFGVGLFFVVSVGYVFSWLVL